MSAMTTSNALLYLARDWLLNQGELYYYSIEQKWGIARDNNDIWMPGAGDPETRANFCLLIREAIKGN